FEGCIRFKSNHFDYALSQIALISYSLYLLHPAALKIVESIGEKLNQINCFVPQSLLAVCGFALSLGISGVSFKFIEKPFLSLKRSELNQHN
ncbi:hypothetical protein OAL13_01570, partial [bacterium]|nr:hypothetical protein [bacterium]